ncbi:type II toxin-antitoxin system prevent-host-death family antitoxin [Humibacter sp. BT305]|nr:type II toxin-antitoxin system prevent-host-death family antitoxin [Humibacter sp. BT305]
MAEVGIRALKQNASAVVARVAAGETVTITDRGRPVALMTPIRPSRVEEMIASGQIRPATRSLADMPKPRPLTTPGPTLSEVLQQMRDEDDR